MSNAKRLDRGRVARAAALGGLAVFAVAVFVIVVFGGSGSYRVNAVFEDVRGLIPGGEVRVGADKIGSVESIELTKDELPKVTMSVDKDYVVRQGAFANIRLASNLGGVNRYVELSRGSGPRLEDGATLGPRQTDQPVDLDLAVSDLDPKTRRQVGALIAGVDASVKNRGSDLDRTLRYSGDALNETANLLGEVNTDGVALRIAVRQTRRVLSALAAGRSQVGDSAERLAQVLALTARRQRELGRTARALAPGLRGARRTLDAIGNGIPALKDLAIVSGPGVAELGPTARLIRPTIGALRPLLRQAGALVRATPGQLRRVRPVLRAALPVVKRLRPLLEKSGPLLDYLRVFAPETVGFFTNWADAASNFDAAGTLARLGFTPGNVERHNNLVNSSDGPIAGLLERPFFRMPGSLEGEPWSDYSDSFISGGKPIQELERGGP